MEATRCLVCVGDVTAFCEFPVFDFFPFSRVPPSFFFMSSCPNVCCFVFLQWITFAVNPKAQHFAHIRPYVHESTDP